MTSPTPETGPVEAQTGARATRGRPSAADRIRWSVKAVDLDPLGSITASRFAIAVGFVSFACALGLTLATTTQVSSWPLAVLALVALVGAYVWIVVRAFGSGIGLSGGEAAVGFGLVALAAALCSASQLGANAYIRDDWGLMVLGLVLVALAPFRAPRELVGYTVVAAILAVALAVGSSLTGLATAAVLPSLPILLVAIAPAIGLGAGSVAYARALVRGLHDEIRGQEEQRLATTAAARRAFVADDVVGSIGALREGVVPLLTRIDRAGAVDADDVRMAAELADSLTRSLHRPSSAEPLSANVGELVDPTGALADLPENGRAALRSLLVGIAVSQHGARERIRLTASADGGVVVAASDDPRALRVDVLPYIRLMKLVLPGTEDEVVDGALRVTCPVRG